MRAHSEANTASESGHVVVVGAGPAGACLSWLLASRGVRVTLVERQSDFAREFRGEILMPSGLEALEQMGLGETFASVPRSVPGEIEFYNNAKRFLQVDLDPELFKGRPPTAFSQPAFLSAVIERCKSQPDFDVRLGTVVTGLLREEQRVTGVRTKGPEGESELRADLVIGTDGRASAVRRHGGFEVQRQGVDVDIVWFKIALPEFFAAKRGVRAYFGRAHLLVCYATWDGRLQLGWVITKGTYGELRDRGLEQWVEEIERHTSADLGAHLRLHRDALDNTFLLSTVSDRVTKWAQPGVLLLGDAAHTMSPVGGQGINVALRDAVVATNWLLPALLGGEGAAAIDRVAGSVEPERMAEIGPIQRIQAVPPKVIMGHTWWSAALRKVLPTLVASPIGKARGAALARRLFFGIGEVRLER
ncbi:MAG: FAD-dependent monooxygenase [Acidobacteriota bacterium]|nr:FAD-dependent monooxygenase [Acidobacteriota bacterium]